MKLYSSKLEDSPRARNQAARSRICPARAAVVRIPFTARRVRMTQLPDGTGIVFPARARLRALHARLLERGPTVEALNGYVRVGKDVAGRVPEAHLASGTVAIFPRRAWFGTGGRGLIPR